MMASATETRSRFVGDDDDDDDLFFEDDDSYVPEGLADFVAQARQTLKNTKQSLAESMQSPSPQEFDPVDDIIPPMIEDDDDLNLKASILQKMSARTVSDDILPMDDGLDAMDADEIELKRQLMERYGLTAQELGGPVVPPNPSSLGTPGAPMVVEDDEDDEELRRQINEKFATPRALDSDGKMPAIIHDDDDDGEGSLNRNLFGTPKKPAFFSPTNESVSDVAPSPRNPAAFLTPNTARNIAFESEAPTTTQNGVFGEAFAASTQQEEEIVMEVEEDDDDSVHLEDELNYFVDNRHEGPHLYTPPATGAGEPKDTPESHVDTSPSESSKKADAKSTFAENLARARALASPASTVTSTSSKRTPPPKAEAKSPSFAQYLALAQSRSTGSSPSDSSSPKTPRSSASPSVTANMALARSRAGFTPSPPRSGKVATPSFMMGASRPSAPVSPKGRGSKSSSKENLKLAQLRAAATPSPASMSNAETPQSSLLTDKGDGPPSAIKTPEIAPFRSSFAQNLQFAESMSKTPPPAKPSITKSTEVESKEKTTKKMHASLFEKLTSPLKKQIKAKSESKKKVSTRKVAPAPVVQTESEEKGDKGAKTMTAIKPAAPSPKVAPPPTKPATKTEVTTKLVVTDEQVFSVEFSSSSDQPTMETRRVEVEEAGTTAPTKDQETEQPKAKEPPVSEPLAKESPPVPVVEPKVDPLPPVPVAETKAPTFTETKAPEVPSAPVAETKTDRSPPAPVAETKTDRSPPVTSKAEESTTLEPKAKEASPPVSEKPDVEDGHPPPKAPAVSTPQQAVNHGAPVANKTKPTEPPKPKLSTKATTAPTASKKVVPTRLPASAAPKTVRTSGSLIPQKATKQSSAAKSNAKLGASQIGRRTKGISPTSKDVHHSHKMGAGRTTRSTTLAPRKSGTSERHATQTLRNSHRKVSTVSASRLKTTATAEAKVPLKSTDEAVAKAKERIRQRKLATAKIKVSEQRSDKETVTLSRSSTRTEAISAEEGQARARERVLRRQMLQKKRQEELEARKKAVAAMRTASHPKSNQQKSPPVQRRQLTVPRGPKFSTSTKQVSKATTSLRPKAGSEKTSTASSQAPRNRITKPVPFRLHNHASPAPPPPPRDGPQRYTMAEQIDRFMHGGLRASTPNPAPTSSKLRVTTPVPFHFNGPKPHSTVATPVQGSKPFAEQMNQYLRTGLRDSTPQPNANRELKLTIPKSPKFTPIPRRSKPKSTAQKEKEIMDYYASHPFKAAPVMMNSSAPAKAHIPKPEKKRQLTTPIPFRLRTDERGGPPPPRVSPPPQKVTLEDVEECKRQFKARPTPEYLSKPKPVEPKKPVTRKKLTQPKPFNFSSSRATTRSGLKKAVEDEAEMKKQFRARPIPKSMFTAPRRNPSPSSRTSTITTRTSPPRLSTPERSRSRQAATLAARLRVDQMAQKKEEIRVRRQQEEHKKAIAEANKNTILTRPKESIKPFHLRSQARHEECVKKMAEERERELEEERRMHEFHAQPLKLSPPPKIYHSTKPLTVPEPFHLEMDIRHEQYQRQLEARLEEEKQAEILLRQPRARKIPAALYNPKPVTPRRASPVRPKPPGLRSAQRVDERREYEQRLSKIRAAANHGASEQGEDQMALDSMLPTTIVQSPDSLVASPDSWDFDDL